MHMTVVLFKLLLAFVFDLVSSFLYGQISSFSCLLIGGCHIVRSLTCIVSLLGHLSILLTEIMSMKKFSVHIYWIKEFRISLQSP
jgi:hypothetical protein